MILSKVTITGADNFTDIQQIIEISKKYPFVEWGILFSKKRLNTPRYPTKYFAYSLRKLAEEQGVNNIKLSAHICGEWTREFFNGDFTFKNYFESVSYHHIFNRVQLNFNAANYPYKLDKVLDIIKNEFSFFIFQHNRSNFKLCNEVQAENLANVDFLYDSSGGRGTSRKDWPSPINCHYTGYAGGLNTVNLEEQLSLIEQSVTNDEEIWIDVETGVRNSEDQLDLEKVKQFLEIASKFINIHA